MCSNLRNTVQQPLRFFFNAEVKDVFAEKIRGQGEPLLRKGVASQRFSLLEFALHRLWLARVSRVGVQHTFILDLNSPLLDTPRFIIGALEQAYNSPINYS